MKPLWKSMRAGMKSGYGTIDWKIGEWQEAKGEIQACKNGFHASELIVDAIRYVNCEVLAKVEVDGKSDISKDKQAWQKMRIIDAWQWEKEHSVKLAVFAAEQVLHIWENKYPKDDRPRKAIEAAKSWTKNKTAAANATYDAYAANAAADAAYDAADAARYAAYADAANATDAAADAAAYAAAAAAYDAANATDAAAADVKNNCEQYILNEILPTLKRYRPATTPDNIAYLRDDEVFVFGSNKEGNHAGGAARTAVDLFGAIEGQGEGLQGQSYAIPTMGTNEEMQDAIKRFVEYAEETPDKYYYMTKIGTGIAGRAPSKAKGMFPKRLPENIIMPDWEEQ